MTQLVIRRLGAGVLLILFVTVAVNALLYLVPGDPAVSIAGEGATEAQIEAVRQRLGLNQPFLVQYTSWLSDAIRGDLGETLVGTSSVRELVFGRLGVTISLTFVTLVLTVLVSVPAAVAAARRPNGWADRLVTIVTSVGLAMPSFWVGILLVIIFSVSLGWLPATGYVPLGESPWEWFRHMLMPAVALSTATVAEATRQLRGALASTMHAEFVRTARAKGLRERTVLAKHILRNAAGPFVTVLGLQVSLLIGGAIIVEQVFALPGIGQLAIRGVLDRDIALIQGVVVVVTVLVTLTSLAVDIVHGYLNPKVRAS